MKKKKSVVIYVKIGKYVKRISVKIKVVTVAIMKIVHLEFVILIHMNVEKYKYVNQSVEIGKFVKEQLVFLKMECVT